MSNPNCARRGSLILASCAVLLTPWAPRSQDQTRSSWQTLTRAAIVDGNPRPIDYLGFASALLREGTVDPRSLEFVLDEDSRGFVGAALTSTNGVQARVRCEGMEQEAFPDDARLRIVARGPVEIPDSTEAYLAHVEISFDVGGRSGGDFEAACHLLLNPAASRRLTAGGGILNAGVEMKGSWGGTITAYSTEWRSGDPDPEPSLVACRPLRFPADAHRLPGIAEALLHQARSRLRELTSALRWD
jgi:hypothetical protein